MQTPTTIDCPSWCVALHHDDGVDISENVPVVDIYGKAIETSAFQAGQLSGVYFGDYELSPAAAREAAQALLTAADLADQPQLAGVR